MNSVKYILIAVLCGVPLPIFAYDILHLYRATPFILKPRFDRDSLFSFDFFLQTGSKRRSRNFTQDSVPLLDLFGIHNMKALAKSVPNLSPNNNLDQILLRLLALPDNGTFGMLSIGGRFMITEANIFLTQNMHKYGFFGQLHLPVRSLSVGAIKYTDLSPLTGAEPNRDTLEWKQFLQSFDHILQRYGISQKPIQRTFAGDLSLLLGWTRSFQEMVRVDFVDLTFLAGLTLPTGPKDSTKHFTALPFFDGGHWGFPFDARISVGAYDWLTIGFYGEVTWFVRRQKQKRIQTSPEQSGLIRLTTTEVTAHKGTKWLVGGFIEADHWVRGLSCSLGYSYATKSRDTIEASQSLFQKTLINTDQLLKSWNMHTLHFALEYDFAEEGRQFGPRIGLISAVVLGGKRIIRTNLFGGTLGLELLWRL